MKKILSLVLALALLLPCTALAVQSDFEIVEGVLTEYTGPGGDVVIPDGVASIGNYAFYDCDSLTGVTIPNSVTSIGNYAFFDCDSLTGVTIPDSVTTIGRWAFPGCASLVGISVAAGNPAYTSRDGVLFDKGQTTLVAYPGGRVGAYTIPAGVTSIEQEAFQDCDSLTDVTIPDSVISIGNSAFWHCNSLTSISVDTNNPVYASRDGVLFNKAQAKLIVCPEGRTGTYTVPENVTSIGNYAFWNCDSLTDITIPGSVTSIGEFAFERCDGLTSVICEAGMREISEGVFRTCPSLREVTIPSTVTILQGTLFSDEDLSRVVLNVAAGSLAEAYAKAHGIAYVANQPYIQPESESETVMAYPSTQMVNVSGTPVEFQMYALKDGDGNLTNYIKLRDLLYVLGNRGNVTWDGVITLNIWESYVQNGSELTTPFRGERLCVHQTTYILVRYDRHREAEHLDAITLTDDAGGGYTYFKLRDLGEILSLAVTWDAENGISINY